MSDGVLGSPCLVTGFQEELSGKLHIGEYIDFNKVLRYSLSPQLKAKFNLVLRSDVLPFMYGTTELVEQLFALLGRMLQDATCKSDSLFLYITSRKESASSELANMCPIPAQGQYTMDFYTNLFKDQDWILRSEAILAESASLARQLNGKLSFYPSANSGRIFSFTFSGKPG